jgi:hypothetical protein
MSPLDRPVIFTHFSTLAAGIAGERKLVRFRDLAGVIEQTTAAEKRLLPLLSFARYGEERTAKGSLRHDRNVLSITAISGDHDAGTMTLAEARELLADAGIAAVLHTTPSHAPGAPHWHVFCPLDGEQPPDQHERLTARLNGVLHGALSRESFVLSQSYYYGHVLGAACLAVVADGR